MEAKMKIVTFFFSGTGNTWWVAQKITDIFNEMGHNAVCCSIEKNMSIDYFNRIEEFDITGFAYPIYGADFPPIFKTFLDELIKKRSCSCVKKCFTMCTIGYVNALGPFVAGKHFNKAHFKLIGHLNLKLSNNASAPHFRSRIKNGNELEIQKEKVLKELRKYAIELTNNRKRITGIGPYLIPGYIIRKISNPAIKKSHEILSIDISRCSQCKLCINMCPTNSIVLTDKTFAFRKTCTACLRCYNTCPKNAILHTGKYADPERYIRYKGPEKDWYRQMLSNK